MMRKHVHNGTYLNILRIWKGELVVVGWVQHSTVVRTISVRLVSSCPVPGHPAAGQAVHLAVPDILPRTDSLGTLQVVLRRPPPPRSTAGTVGHWNLQPPAGLPSAGDCLHRHLQVLHLHRQIAVQQHLPVGLRYQLQTAQPIIVVITQSKGEKNKFHRRIEQI